MKNVTLMAIRLFKLFLPKKHEGGWRMAVNDLCCAFADMEEELRHIKQNNKPKKG